MKSVEFIIENTVDEAEEGTYEAEEIVSTLEKAGYKHVGSGADATVWTKDVGQIIKIIMPDSEDITQAALTFKKFYQFCKDHQDLECLPRFIPIQGHDYTEFTMGSKDYIQISMEQLYPIKRNSFEEGVVWYLSDFVTKNTSWEEIRKILSDPNGWIDFSKANKEALANHFKNLDRIQNSKLQLLYTVMGFLYKTGKINRFGWDLHTENVMKRKDGTLVIIDPWFETYSGTGS